MTIVRLGDLLPHLTDEESVEYARKVHAVPAKQRFKDRYAKGVKMTLSEVRPRKKK